MPYSSDTLFIPIGSSSQAMRAQRALSAAAIPSSVEKGTADAHRGCVYGVRFSAGQKNNVHVVLRTAGIHFRSARDE